MKCSKCGYTSFDYLDNCNKCGFDLRDIRTQLQIIAVSPEERAPAVSPAAATAAKTAAAYSVSATPPEMDFTEISEMPEPPPLPEKSEAEKEAEGIFEGLDFDESFGDIVEHTSYEAEPIEAPTKFGSGETQDQDEELLDLDFDDLFGDK